MDIELKGITENYRERMQRLALFDPLFRLENKREKDENNQPIDYFGYGLLTLLFFFENMLIRNKKTSIQDLAQYLYTINRGEYSLSLGGFEKVARTIVETFRPPSGKRNEKTFYNWETREYESVHYSILKADRADVSSNTQYYKLDEQGLELVFATKEYFTEFQLSINQLVLRKQLEKGEFVGALRQIDEMHIDVESLRNRMTIVKHEIQRNIISDETYERYKQMVEDINSRLTRENEEFTELHTFVKETKNRLAYDMNSEKEQKAYELILQIDRELGEVHHTHTMLLKESIDLKTTALHAAQEALYFVGIDSFNFKQEITAPLVSKPLPLVASKRLIEPFLKIEQSETWSPLVIFSEQRIETQDGIERTNDFDELSDEVLQELENAQVRKLFGDIMTLLLKIMEGKDAITLKEVVERIRVEDPDWLNRRLFYQFWYCLHQRSPIIHEKREESNESLFEEVLELIKHQYSSIEVEELPEIITVTERFSIQNMKLRLIVGEEDGL
ncbi:replicative DNA helicase [Bacillus sp. DTU_2020_1000418_1_SI_GHA_SEK_038]|uniref:replicative DNA helicase n=1 Tax=Bacillus sp. DTU_2020_1000418_1_SI_GHA_SEK_038 TaxID=3077585 RepID=UPI0028E54DD9|nr:replicative DNA helicase [Bacillus sp. DTU_2020_1000418_1_SI_GHA_SEK_038]WNS76042.1 replicative DNA helicase [Bacillus sp. DTU_2020_1000418_1_SI_GHA_SEK_038]